MIAIGAFRTQVKLVRELFRSLALLGRQVESPLYGDVQASSMKRLTYREQYEKCFAGDNFDFLLKDQSLVQFRRWSNKGILKFSYSYMECPREIVPYEDFLFENFQESESAVGDLFHAEYEEYLETSASKETVTPIRYDYAIDEYAEGRHPVSHLHVGHQTEVRIAIKKVLLPRSFALLIVRQCYPATWTRFLSFPGMAGICRDIRARTKIIAGKYWNPKDEHQLYLV